MQKINHTIPLSLFASDSISAKSSFFLFCDFEEETDSLKPGGGELSLKPGGGVMASLKPGGGRTSPLKPGGGVTESLKPGGGVTSSLNPGGGAAGLLFTSRGVVSTPLAPFCGLLLCPWLSALSGTKWEIVKTHFNYVKIILHYSIH